MSEEEQRKKNGGWLTVEPTWVLVVHLYNACLPDYAHVLSDCLSLDSKCLPTRVSAHPAQFSLKAIILNYFPI